MKFIKTPEEMMALRKSLEGKTIGFAPTMGGLHNGHLSLINKSKSENEVTVVSVYLNETQFNDKNDLLTYPSNFEDDVKLLENAGVDYLFAPDYKVMYPDNYRYMVTEKEFSKLFIKAYSSAGFESDNPIVTLETISQYQSLALIMYIRMWVCDGCYGNAGYEEVCEAYVVMLFHGGSLVSTSKLIELAAGKLWTSIPSHLKKITDLIGKKNR